MDDGSFAVSEEEEEEEAVPKEGEATMRGRCIPALGPGRGGAGGCSMNYRYCRRLCICFRCRKNSGEGGMYNAIFVSLFSAR